MNDFFDSLPSARQMVKLIVFLLLLLIVAGLVAALVKLLMPLLVLAVLVFAGVYFLSRKQNNHAVS